MTYNELDFIKKNISNNNNNNNNMISVKSSSDFTFYLMSKIQNIARNYALYVF